MDGDSPDLLVQRSCIYVSFVNLNIRQFGHTIFSLSVRSFYFGDLLKQADFAAVLSFARWQCPAGRTTIVAMGLKFVKCAELRNRRHVILLSGDVVHSFVMKG